MSRSGYTEDLDHWALIRYRGQVARAIRGRRGQAMLRDLLTALDAMTAKRLVASALEADGEVCALGALGRMRGLDMSTLDPEDPKSVARAFDIADQLAREVAYMNDEYTWNPETPESRWLRMREWVASNVTPVIG